MFEDRVGKSILGGVDVGEKGEAVRIGDVGGRKNMRVCDELISRCLVVGEDHPDAASLANHLSFLHPRVVSADANDYLPPRLRGVERFLQAQISADSQKDL